ncbi:DUF4124 domain-containing protein [Pseudomonas sp. PDM15]|uniref:DUF4124 domain-containing protein n=1 Tax=Pseudomonas sp. PDM15 TaxID=2769303 RepID=UPI001783B43D|nr:DUF4124 domain-containing protein [Pseudomonas sp. PDM15]MBD9427620.1 DUF4124 domain-containing protein [Pseudomonas sp. PDM15]
MRRMILACSVLLALSTGATAGQIYKWVDGQGNVHFGSQPPEGQDAATVNPNISQPKLAAPPAAPQQESAEKAQEDANERVRKEVAEQEAELKNFCDNARYNLAQLQNNPRIRMEIDGELRHLTEEERQERISTGEAALKKNCQ